MVLERKEFKSKDKIKSEKLLEQGIEEMVSSLKENKPILISAIKRWSEEKKFHMMVLTGFEEEDGRIKGFYYNDPDTENGEGQNLFVDIGTFKRYWRRLAIFVK